MAALSATLAAVSNAAPAPVLQHVAPVPVDVHLMPQQRLQQRTVELIPVPKVIEKIVEIPEIQSVEDSQTSESLGTAPVCQMKPAETVEVVVSVTYSSTV